MEGLLAFRVKNYNNTAEREQFRFLCEQLKARYSGSSELCVFVGNYDIGCELDALLIKNDAIIAIEFKNYGGHVVARQNGDWTCDGKVIYGGGTRKTVLQQALTNHSLVKRGLKYLGVDSNQIKDVPTLVIFHQAIELENKLINTTRSWLHITDDNNFIKKLDDITCPRTDLGTSAIIKLVELLNLNPFYLSEFSNVEDYNPEQESEVLKLIESTKEKVWESVNDESDESVSQVKNTQKLDKESRTNLLDIERTNNIAEQKFFISQILSTLLIQSFDIELFNLEDKRIDAIFPKHKFSRERIIKVESENISVKASKIGRFMGKEVYTLSPNCIFWEDGEVILEDKEHNENLPISKEQLLFATTLNIQFKKSNTVLPAWLDKKIFGEFGAVYAPEYERFKYNLDLNSNELRVYLGTYFPRSYAEIFCIADNLFQNDKYNKTLVENEEINILDCGCGTGGEIIGLITALGKYFPQCHVNVTAIDGNERALQILNKLICEFPTNAYQQIKIEPICKTFATSSDLNILFESLKKSYQFILCDKMVCELISKKILTSNAYAVLAEQLTPSLADNGLLIILDVTTKDEHTGYFYPQLMNKELNEYVAKSKTIETLLPLSCGCNDNCNDLCFMQQTFYVDHSRKSKDESRVCYRVLCKKVLRNSVIGTIPINEYAHLIHPIKYKQNDESAICKHTKEKKTIIDTFNINI